jgi:(4S)-4-hydroxy-5-phosphonooxypentane-2,3-dione isomerase
MNRLGVVGAAILLSTFHPAVAQVPHSYLMYIVNLDIAAADFDKFMAASRDNAEASLKDEGCHEFNIGISKDEPHHVLFVEVYDNADALSQHQKTDHFKRYESLTKDMVTKRQTAQFLSVPMDFSANAK